MPLEGENGGTIAKLQQRSLSYMETGTETRAETEQSLGPVQARARLEPEASDGIIGGYGGSSEGVGEDDCGDSGCDGGGDKRNK